MTTRRSGRELTLLSVYGLAGGPPAGAKSGARKPQPSSKRPGNAARRLVVRTPPTATEPVTRQSVDAGAANENGDGKEDGKSGACADGRVETDNEASVGAAAGRVGYKELEPQMGGSPRGQDGRTKVRCGARSPKSRTSENRTADLETQDPNVVMSFYGDGFIEVTARDTCVGSVVDVPFTIRLRLFKAADEVKEKSEVESDASRHLYPELNDEGEFVRWSCCGSTNKSVFGCPVATQIQTQNLSVEDLFRLHPPKLIACKIGRSMTASDNLRFVIFDRGLPSGLSPNQTGAVNAGCRVWWKDYECWATGYEIPTGRWLDLTINFDGYHVRILVDDDLVDIAPIVPSSSSRIFQCRSKCALGCSCPGAQWCSASGALNSVLNSVYVGGYAKYSKCVNKWRSRSGFVGLIAEITIKNVPRTKDGLNTVTDKPGDIVLRSVNVGELKEVSSAGKVGIVIHRNVLWRKVFPPFVNQEINSSIRLLDNFYHGAHNDIVLRDPKSLENVLLSNLQVGDVRIAIKKASEFHSLFGSDHGCRSQAEYAAKCHDFIRFVEQLSPLLTVIVNPSDEEPPVGTFEVYIELCRSPGSAFVSILLHSMQTTSSFPSRKDIRGKIIDVLTHEARRSPGEEVTKQALRYFLSLAQQFRGGRERLFMESVMNRKAVITEKRITEVFQRIGFCFAQSELQELIRMFKTMQDGFMRHQHRMDDIPTVALVSPSSAGTYHLPLVHQVSLTAITPCDRIVSQSPWRFVSVFLNFDLQLLEFLHDGTPSSTFGDSSYFQSRFLHGGFVDRMAIDLTQVPSHVYCILFSLKIRGGHETGQTCIEKLQTSCHQCNVNAKNAIRVELENSENLHHLVHFEALPHPSCKWLCLGALYRTRRSKMWRFQALGGSLQATTIHSSLEEMNGLLVDRNIVPVYDVIVCYHDGRNDGEFSEFAARFSKNIRFGRNGNIIIIPLGGCADSEAQEIERKPPTLEISLRIQGHTENIVVYTFDGRGKNLPTIQSVCRSVLRVLADHGIKESLQQNPFAIAVKKVKRPVNIRVVSDETNVPIANAYIFVEKSLDHQSIVTNLASKIVPTLTMGSRLVSIRKRIQKKKYAEEVMAAARNFVAEVVDLGIRYALVSVRDAKLVPIVKSRAVLRRAMRRRREAIMKKILDAMSESERSRIYSRSGPVRLQQLYRQQLNLTNSEKDLLAGLAELEIDDFRRELGLSQESSPDVNPHAHVEEMWQRQLQESRSATTVPDPRIELSNDAHNFTRRTAVIQPPTNLISRSGKTKRSYLTDENGSVACTLAPGSYSVYVFHIDYFEWTSLTVIFPTVNASGLFGSSLSMSAPQEIVAPLESFKWSYGIQIVDFYQQHITKLVEGVPIQIIDKVTSEQTILTTNAGGNIQWDVRKGIYSVRVLTENTSIIYSGTKNVIVDGGRYHPPRTIFIPVLFGKVAIEISVGRFPGSVNATSHDAIVEIVAQGDSRATSRPADELEARALGIYAVPLDSSLHHQLRPGVYTLHASAEGFFPYETKIAVPWNAAASAPSHALILLCPYITEVKQYRIFFSHIGTHQSIDAMVGVEDQKGERTYWRHGPTVESEDVVLHGATSLGNCSFQAFSIQCREGSKYFLRIATAKHHTCSTRPRVQVYRETGLLMDSIADDPVTWANGSYWVPCQWDEKGEFRGCHTSQNNMNPK